MTTSAPPLERTPLSWATLQFGGSLAAAIGGCESGPAGARLVATRRGLAVVELIAALPAALGARDHVDSSLEVVRRGGPVSVDLDRAIDELGEYVAGERRRFGTRLDLGGRGAVPFDWIDDDGHRLELRVGRGSDLERAVWTTLRDVPWGTLWSYGRLADVAGVGRRAARAVGGAVGRNPLPIFVPCHRVVGASGHLTGFSCGLEWKIALLDIEDVSVAPAGTDGELARRRVLVQVA